MINQATLALDSDRSVLEAGRKGAYQGRPWGSAW